VPTHPGVRRQSRAAIWSGRRQRPSCVSTIGAAADLEFHPVGVPKEQRPLIAQPLDVAHLLCASGGQALFERLERGVRVDGERVVVNGTAPTLPAPVADDLVRRNLEDVERGSATEVEDLHPGVVFALRNFEGDYRVERLLVEAHGQIHVRRERRHVVEAVGERHGEQCTCDVRVLRAATPPLVDGRSQQCPSTGGRTFLGGICASRETGSGFVQAAAL
jgi:hypothetical protein